jgi:hypothetical protein
MLYMPPDTCKRQAPFYEYSHACHHSTLGRQFAILVFALRTRSCIGLYRFEQPV